VLKNTPNIINEEKNTKKEAEKEFRRCKHNKAMAFIEYAKELSLIKRKTKPREIRERVNLLSNISFNFIMKPLMWKGDKRGEAY